jgi:hypothetical protein
MFLEMLSAPRSAEKATPYRPCETELNILLQDMSSYNPVQEKMPAEKFGLIFTPCKFSRCDLHYLESRKMIFCSLNALPLIYSTYDSQ